MERIKGFRDARRWLAVAIAFELCLTVGFLLDDFIGPTGWVFRRVFDLQGEMNLPALFSAAQLGLVGVVFAVIAARRRVVGSPRILAWIGAGFVFLGFDEAFSIHESITRNFRGVAWLPGFQGTHARHGLWVVPYLSAGALFAAIAARSLLQTWRAHHREAALLAIGFAIFVIGGVGLEVFGYEFLGQRVSRNINQLEVAAEEFLEMAGISVVLYGAVRLDRMNRD